MKDRCLTNLQERIADLQQGERKRFTKEVAVNKGQQHNKYGTATYQWIEGPEHKGHR